LLAEGSVIVAKAFIDILLAAVLNAESAKGLVEALGVGDGLEEELASWRVVHPAVHECDSWAGRLGDVGQAKRLRVI
jgi:hypothetical protein